MVVYRIDLKRGDAIGRYRIIDSLGSGSYGDVYLVQGSHNRYALKILRLFAEPSNLHKNLVDRFDREYETAKMPGDYFVHSFEYSELKGNPYYTMEYCPNGDLAKYVGRNTSLLPSLAHDILMGLYDLHSDGKNHRDLKPENVLIRKNGKAALTDFGAVGNKRNSLTLTNIFNRPKQRFGTPLYMAPEMYELKGGGVTHLQTIDIWSFGVMMYELLTGGTFPFGNPVDDSGLEAYFNHAKKEQWNRQILQNVSHGREWLPIIGRCLKPDYRERYQNVLEILTDLEPMIEKPVVQSILKHRTRSVAITKLTITQGENEGKVYQLQDMLVGYRRMIRVGRSEQNDIVLKCDAKDTYVSRFHFTLERSAKEEGWMIKDGQWNKESRQWQPSTNGTYLNTSRVTTSDGLQLYTGDIITAGEYKFKVE